MIIFNVYESKNGTRCLELSTDPRIFAFTQLALERVVRRMAQRAAS